jgi:Tol biopolymer transport system component
VRFLIAPPDGMTLQSAGVISPDGRWLVYVGADSSGQSMLMLRALADIDAKPIAGTDGASTPFWSPDSQEIAFFGDTALKRVNVIGETSVRTVVEAFPTRGGGRGGGTWGQGGIIVYAPSRLTELYAVPATGGTARAVSALSPRSRETAHQWPQFLPDGRHFLYTALGRRPEDGGIYVASLDSPERTLILQSAVRAVFAPSGYLLFAQEGSLLAQRFDPSTFRLQGSTRVVASIPNQTDVMISAAQNDALTYAGMLNPARELAWFDRQGRRLTTVTSETVLAPALSPDERRVAGEHRGEIWLVELLHGQASRFMLGPDIVTSPVWSPDGNRLAVASRRAIYVRGANDSGRPELVADGMATPPTLYDWSSDGRYILYTARTPETQWDLWILPLAGSHTPAPFLRTPFTEYQARISPDGRWVAYVSDESSTLEVYVDAFPERGHKVQVSSQGGTHPTWRGDGKELFYLTMDKKLVAAELSPGAGFQIGSRHALFQTRIAGIARNHYTASADGQRFLINSPVSYATISPITIVMNWSSLLQ